ncbi:YveK family protein [Ferviditalea candida]|uniref:Wzz/FepE/Etk N-terminal domain-containing protein n=1 Tax=Ferviditalea candida TaxID=3108399 RepID=A0ABU5ZEY7_9BACL|nr:Wzz/FepE/Etk N-terminal domain-containing protein [Paenibacillaceae bacterium T2]
MEIDLRKYYKMLRKRVWIIVVCALVFTIPAAVFTSDKYNPIYQASSEFMINNDGSQKQIDYGAISVIIGTPVIMDKVVQWFPDLNLTADQLNSSVDVSTVNDSKIIRITAQDSSYERAVKIANDVTQVIKSEIPKIMKVSGVTVLNAAQMKDNSQPINQNSHKYIKTVLLSFVVSIVVAVGIILLLDSLDDTLRSEVSIRSIFDKPTLAVVPKIKEKETGSPARRNLKVREASHASSSS